MKKEEEKDYILGVNEYELERLRFQHGVWKKVTDEFLDRLKIQQGWRCLDAGAGPGFVSMDLRERVGGKGEVTALEPSKFYLEKFRNEAEKKGWTNIKYINQTAEEANLPSKYYDFIFVRWVIGFVPDSESFLTNLLDSLKRGGVIALQDYNYEGLSLFPRGGAFDKMPGKVKEYYQSGGGDPYVASVIPGIFRKHSIKLFDYTPVCLAGGPDSGVFQWAQKFFMKHTQAMADKGLISQEECDAVLEDWE
ncbi:MAG: class I SAM-dependent methyltransferase, partial [Ignavibacteria bacterium]